MIDNNQHFVHYVRREVVLVDYKNSSDPWFAHSQLNTQEFHTPSHHATRSLTGAPTRVKVGDLIWLFSQLYSTWGSLPPSLDAKLKVKNVADSLTSQKKSNESDGFRYEAGQESKWYPLFDATSLIHRLKTVDSKGNVQSLLSQSDQPIGQALQSMRELTDGNLITEWEKRIHENPVDFVSYRQIDGTRLAFKKVSQLMNDNQPVIWDRWSLPRRLAERREFLCEEALDLYIFKLMKQCRTIWGIRSPKYGEPGSYSARELKEARRLQKFQYHS